MRSPRSPGSSFVRPTVASMGAISYRRCRRIFAAPATISIPRPATSRRHYCARLHEAKMARAAEVVVWGSGTPRREFLYVDDLADAGIHLLQHHSGESHINIGAGYDVTIAEF